MLTVLLPPENVGVAPTTEPSEAAIVTLCGSCDELVKSTVTLPAFALSEDLSNFRLPPGSAARDTELDADEAAVELELELAAGAGELLVVFDEDDLLEPPHAPRPSASRV